jgi:hypothetical protein
MASGYKWKPLERADAVREPRPELVREWMQRLGYDEAGARAAIAAEFARRR